MSILKTDFNKGRLGGDNDIYLNNHNEIYEGRYAA
jgi:hypothetical protein